MRLADYIETHTTAIVDQAEVFARSLTDGKLKLDSETLRDHLPQILEVVVADLRSAQTLQQEQERAEGLHDTPESDPLSPAQWHGQLRARSGFSIEQLVAEFRVLRASVLRLWSEQHPGADDSLEDMLRFNQAIDQAIAESVAHHAAEARTWHNIFLGVLGHDLRGPLTAILLTSNLMTQMTTDAPLSRLARRLVMSGERMSTLLDDLLDFSRSSLGVGLRITRRNADLAQELHEEIDMLRMAWPDTRIHHTSHGAIHGAYDASRVREAMANLVNNAVKHGEAGGDVRIHLDSDEEGIVLTVENSGAAISDDTLSRMFDPLQRGPMATGQDDGTSLGLGLFVVREIARAHDGEVAVTCAGDRTVFTMQLPAHAPGERPAAPPRRFAADPR